MHDLRKPYNRRYYRRMFWVHTTKYWCLLKVHVSGLLLKLAFKISPDVKSTYERLIIEHHENKW